MFFFLFFGIYLRRLCFPLSSTMTAMGRSASESWGRPWRSWWASSSTTARSTRSCETSTWTGTDRWTSRVSASVFMVLRTGHADPFFEFFFLRMYVASSWSQRKHTARWDHPTTILSSPPEFVRMMSRWPARRLQWSRHIKRTRLHTVIVPLRPPGVCIFFSGTSRISRVQGNPSMCNCFTNVRCI